MAKDYTKYKIEGLGENLNKRQLVFTIVKDYISKNKILKNPKKTIEAFFEFIFLLILKYEPINQ